MHGSAALVITTTVSEDPTVRDCQNANPSIRYRHISRDGRYPKIDVHRAGIADAATKIAATAVDHAMAANGSNLRLSTCWGGFSLLGGGSRHSTDLKYR